MDRQAHDYAAAMAFAQQQQQANIQQQQQQQQQQFGFHPQSPQFPQQVHGPPFMAPHPSLPQQFPFPRHLPPQPQPLLHHGPHPPPHSHHPLLHLQQQQPPPAAFAPHLPPHLMPSHFVNPFDQPPPPAAPPSDPELHKRIDKLVEYSVKNGPEFEAMIREKQQDNPAYSFLFGAEGHAYYRYKFWLSTRPPGPPFNTSFPTMIPPPNPLNPNPLNPPPINPAAGTPQLHQPPFPPFFDQQHPQPFIPQPRPEYESSTKTFKGLNGPLPSDVAAELIGVLNNLNGTKESIKGAKSWFMQRSPFAPALAEALRDRVLTLDDSERQLHIIYLANDILFDSLQRRANPHELDNEALAFKPVLGSMLAKIYHNPLNKDANQSRLQKILQFWASKEVYDPDTIYALEGEMIAGPPAKPLSVFPQDAVGNSSDTPGLIPSGLSQRGTDKQRSPASGPPDLEQQDKQIGTSAANPTLAASQFVPPVTQPFISSQQPVGMFPAVGQVPFGTSLPLPSSAQPASLVTPTPTPNVVEKPHPYPLFPPGLIPGMVRKMQIGSGVPYSPMSPLDIPTVIPPSTIPPSDILDRVSKFFKEIGEVNPSEGPMKASETTGADDDYEREPPVRKGGACIPPPLNLQVDPETGTYPDGSVERKPGSSGSGRLGLGATANPNEVSQYDDVYTSYRKQRSTSYHTSMSARAAAR
ncbi:hypothetical protein H6P81_004302 [Aristolochia fimbriata]|uniref:Calcium homeostasis endoplasmic reticulum protein n=1 Tax=Aristolochia fimbriata TaxID=158543 RepID=A0AAV7FFI5_ARIFI|nr:hypothetical protein H6P81_004302 [Aristolochia fimbriata]